MAITQGPPAQDVNKGFFDQVVGTVQNVTGQFIDAFGQATVDAFLPRAEGKDIVFGPAAPATESPQTTPSGVLGTGSINVGGVSIDMGLLVLLLGGGLLLFVVAK